MIKILLAATLLAVAAPIGIAQTNEPPWYNKEVVIRGDYFKAASVAYADFSKSLDERRVRGPSAKNKKLAQYLAVIDNYDVQVGAGPGRYLVWITPRFSEEFPADDALTDAGAFYELDAETFTVREKRY